MSRKKISTTVAFEEFILAKLDERSQMEQRSRNYILGKILREYFGLTEDPQARESKNANQP